MHAINASPAPWVSSVFLGSLLTLGLFSFLPLVPADLRLPSPEVFRLNVTQWQAPAKTSKPAIDPEPTPVQTPPSKSQSKPKPKSKIPKPSVNANRPAVAEKTPAPAPSPTHKPVRPDTIASPVSSAVATEDVPVPVPVFKLSKLPRSRYEAPLVYPKSQQQLGRSGKVVLELLIDKQGKVRRVDVKQSLGPEFDAAAMEAMKKSRFTPAEVNGQPAAVRLPYTVTFKLR